MNEPPFWSERRHRLYVLFGLLMVFHLSVHILPWRSVLGLTLPPWAAHAAWFVYIPLLLLWIRTHNAGDQGTRARITKGEMPCWQCGYDLASTTPPGPCPECGLAFEPSAMWEKWERLFGRDLRPGAVPKPVQLATLTPVQSDSTIAGQRERGA